MVHAQVDERVGQQGRRHRRGFGQADGLVQERLGLEVLAGTAQGDGEVCVTAIETALQGRFRLSVLKDRKLIYPQAETPTHYITMGMDADLDRCVEMALRDMITLVSQRAQISREDAYMLCSLAGDLRITQTVNREKGVHMMMAKNLLDMA